ncbi:NAD(P)-dependent oxidoreductase [Streptomyces sp. B1I3]|uniref:NAD-dependent epimerase/dehydratase family protein n=1 Tax=Streptomyces sp. B1I3 TaxID=3042264 RepID=UPI0027812C8C|nr:NAD-dependent epimerase/dehydratase family protein [Streptomyces sp. B1I3]MDQ0797736.1 nucleoside-diphosphate-sugar epimerase [Streptomyces sp. B1I3]
MSRGRAFVLGATGQIGRATVRALTRDGWEVTAASRGGRRDSTWDADVRVALLDRGEKGALATALGDGCDVLVDMIAFGEEHAAQLTRLSDRIGSAVAISSGAVYADGRGRSFDTQDEPGGFPQYPVPIPEDCPTVAPGPATYGTRKIAWEQALIAASARLPVTVLRAGAVHGPHGRTPRELYFVKRVLDGRRRRVLAHGGTSRFGPAHVSNIAELVRLAALRPGTRVLNAADPYAPTVAEIGEAVDAVMGWRSETVLLEPAAPQAGLGRTPWTAEHPVVYDMSAAERELGYVPVTGYAESLPATVEWLTGRLRRYDDDWRAAFPAMAAAYDPHGDLFDYAAEDAWFGER